MFVIDSRMAVMKVKVVNCLGEEWVVDVYPESTVDQLKQMALVHFYHPISCIKTSDQYKLVSVTRGCRLIDECTVRDENLEEREELLLMKGRQLPEAVEESADEKSKKSHGPTKAEIQLATANIAAKNMDRVIEDYPVVVDFHVELRRILVSLVQASEKLLRYHPEIAEIFKDIPADEENSCPVRSVDAVALKQLTDMGFSESRAIMALKINKMSPVEAMDWLLAHEDSESHCDALQTHLNKSKESESSGNLDCPTTSKSSELEACKPNRVATMLNLFRQHKRKEFRPNMKALNNLKEMGFSEEEILDALRIHSNNQDAACEWLLNDRKPLVEDLDNGLDPEGPIYKAIMSNAIVQLGLNSPKTLFALLQMLENLNCASRWLNDSDTAPLLSQIFRIYHAEKHSLQMMRPFSR